MDDGWEGGLEIAVGEMMMKSQRAGSTNPEARQVGQQGTTGGSTACSTLRAQQAGAKQGAGVALLPRGERERETLAGGSWSWPPPRQAGSRLGEKVKRQSLRRQREALRQTG